MPASNRLKLFSEASAILVLSVRAFSASGAAGAAVQARDSLAEAESATRAGKFDVAAEVYRKLLEAHPQSAELWSNMAAVRAMGGHCEEAGPALDRARSLNPALFAPWYFAGFCDLQFHHEEQALVDLKRATEINSRDANAWYLRAQAADNLGRLAEAFEAVLKGLTLEPARPEGYYQAGKTALDLAAACYDRVMAAAPASPYRHQLEGDRDVAQGLMETGIKSYRKALELAPQDLTIRFSLANACLESGKLTEAEAELRESLKLAGARSPIVNSVPYTTWIKLRLARVLAREDRPTEAKQVLGALQPGQFQAPEEFGEFLVCASSLGSEKAAAHALEVGLARFPGDSELGQWKAKLRDVQAASGHGKDTALETGGSAKIAQGVRFLAASNLETDNRLAKMFSSPQEYRGFRAAFLRNDAVSSGRMISNLDHLPGEPGEALVLGSLLQWLSYRFYEKLATAYPESEAAEKLAAENLSSAGQQEKALEIYQAMLERAGPSPELLRAIARIYWTQHKWDEALKALESLNQLDPYDPTTLVNLGRIYSYKQDHDRAERYFERASRRDPAMFEAHLGLGEALRRRGDDEGALREFKIASQIEPSNPRPHYALSQVYRKRDRRELAAQEMATFERLQAHAALEKTRANRLLVPLD